MAFVVIYDACVLYPAPLRDLLLRIALAGVVRAKWSDEILDECFRNVAANRPDLSVDALARTRHLMCEAVPDCLVTNFSGLADHVALPDLNDRHVLAAAIRSNAQVIVTFNLKDFPQSVLAPFGIEAKHPDDFVLDTIGLAPGAIATVVSQQAAALKSPPVSRAEMLDRLRACGLEQSVAQLRTVFGAAS
ncbi:MAG: PIN domain-containing protein [Gemmatimonadaceae bacterium]